MTQTIPLPFRYFRQSDGLLRKKKLRSERTAHFQYHNFYWDVDGRNQSQVKTKSFQFSEEQLLFLDKNWELVSLNGQMRYRNDYWALDSFSFPHETEFLKSLPEMPIQKEHLSGPVFQFTNIGFANYYHVITELLPRLEFMMSLRGKVKIAIAEESPPFVFEALQWLGFTESSYYLLKPDKIYTADTWLVLPWGLNFIPERIHFLKQAFSSLMSDSWANRRFYISRKNEKTRKVTNEAALESVLNLFGFEQIEAEALSLKEQIHQFSQAEIICGPHGAGLSNLIWMKKPFLIEIRPENYPNECFTHLSLISGAEKISVIEARAQTQSLDLYVNPDQLKSAFELFF